MIRLLLCLDHLFPFTFSLWDAIALFTFAVLIPAVSSGVSNALHMLSTTKDQPRPQASGNLSVLGFDVTAVAAMPFVYAVGIVLMSLGSAFIVTRRSLATALVQPDQVTDCIQQLQSFSPSEHC